MPYRRVQRFPICPLCKEPVEINTAKTDDYGNAVHEECYVMSLTRKDATPPPQNPAA
jgi:hypothetical protein